MSEIIPPFNLTLRRTNHIQHHQPLKSKTLMRRGVKRPVVQQKRLKTSVLSYNRPLTLTANRPSLNSRHYSRISHSPFISHFAKPDTRSFIAAPQPIKSIVNKPKVNRQPDLSIDDLIYKAVDNLDTKIQVFEKKPVRGLRRLTKSFAGSDFEDPALN